MKNFILLISLAFTSLVFAQDMKVNQDDKAVVPHDKLRKILLDDETDKNEYSRRYTCHNFAKTFYLQRSSLVDDLASYDIKGIADDWGVIVTRLEEQAKMPIYTLTMVQKEYGFYHMINAILIDEKNPEALESYIFVEPQTDEVFMSPEAVYKRYGSYYDKTEQHEPLTIEIGTFDSFKHNGNIYQSWGKQLYKFEI